MVIDESEKPPGLRLPTAAGATLALWFILLAFGGGCLAWYYMSINYFPKIEWHESLNYLAVLSIIGGGLVVAFGLLAFLPGVVWSEVLLADCKLGPTLRYTRIDGEKEPCIIRVSKVLGLPFAIFILLGHLFFVATAPRTLFYQCAIALAAVVPMFLATWLFVRKVRQALGTREQSDPAPARPTGDECTFRPAKASAKDVRQGAPAAADWLDSSMAKYLSAFVISAALGLVAVLIIGGLLCIDDPPRAAVISFLCVVVIVTANVLVAMIFGTRRGAAALVAASATLFLLVLGEGLEGRASLLHKVMATYGVGEETRYVVVVTDEGRQLLAAQGVNAEKLDGDLGRVRNVAILSRLGEEFLFRCGKRAISLPTDMVASWSTEKLPGKSGNSCIAADLAGAAAAPRPPAAVPGGPPGPGGPASPARSGG